MPRARRVMMISLAASTLRAWREHLGRIFSPPYNTPHPPLQRTTACLPLLPVLESVRLSPLVTINLRPVTNLRHQDIAKNRKSSNAYNKTSMPDKPRYVPPHKCASRRFAATTTGTPLVPQRGCHNRRCICHHCGQRL